MAATRKYDIVAKVGEYTDKQGQKKPRWLTVGQVMEGDKGPFIMLSKWFNPGSIGEPGKDSILLSCFDPKPRTSAPEPWGSPIQKGGSPEPMPDYGEEMPF